MEEESPPVKKCKVDPEKGIKETGSSNNHAQMKQPNVEVPESPATEPMLLPELWAKIFEYMSPDELQTLINTTPEWNRLLHSQKPRILFPKVLACLGGHLHWKEILPFRMVSKACKNGVETAYPEISEIIQTTREIIQAKGEMVRALQCIKARIRLGMRHEVRNEQMEVQGLPVQEVRDDEDEEPVQENEFSEEELQAYVRRRLQGIRPEMQ